MVYIYRKLENMEAILKFKSVGKKHPEEVEFFKFLVKQKFFHAKSRVIQWCSFDGLTVKISALTDEVVVWGKETIGDTVETETGYKYILQ